MDAVIKCPLVLTCCKYGKSRTGGKDREDQDEGWLLHAAGAHLKGNVELDAGHMRWIVPSGNTCHSGIVDVATAGTAMLLCTFLLVSLALKR